MTSSLRLWHLPCQRIPLGCKLVSSVAACWRSELDKDRLSRYLALGGKPVIKITVESLFCGCSSTHMLDRGACSRTVCTHSAPAPLQGLPFFHNISNDVSNGYLLTWVSGVVLSTSLICSAATWSDIKSASNRWPYEAGA